MSPTRINNVGIAIALWGAAAGCGPPVLGGLQATNAGAAVGGAVAGVAAVAAASKGNAAVAADAAVVAVIAGWAVATELKAYRAERTEPPEAATAPAAEPAVPEVLIRETTVRPYVVTAGAEVTFELWYSIRAPAGTSDVMIEEAWSLESRGRIVTQVPSSRQAREPGGWRAVASMVVPVTAPEGPYMVRTRVQVGESVDERVAIFVVKLN